MAAARVWAGRGLPAEPRRGRSGRHRNPHRRGRALRQAAGDTMAGLAGSAIYSPTCSHGTASAEGYRPNRPGCSVSACWIFPAPGHPRSLG